MVGFEKACLKRLRESGLKSETRSSLIHFLSLCYEDPKAVRIFSQQPTGGGSCEEAGNGELVRDGVSVDNVIKDVAIYEENNLQKVNDAAEKVSTGEVNNSQREEDQHMDFLVDVEKDVSTHEVSELNVRDDQMMNFSVDVVKVVSTSEEKNLREEDDKPMCVSVDIVKVVSTSEDKNLRKEDDKPMDVSVDVVKYIDTNEVKDSQEQDGQPVEFSIDVVEDVSAHSMKERQHGEDQCMELSVEVMKEGDHLMDVSVDVVKRVSAKSQQGEDLSMELSIENIENMIMDVDIDAIEGLLEESSTDQEVLKQVQNSLLETTGLGDQLDAILSDVNGFCNAAELDFTDGEAMKCGGVDDKYLSPQNLQLERPDNVLEYANALRTNESNDIEEGEIDTIDTNINSIVSVENNSDIEHHNETVSHQPNDIKQRKLLEEVSCSDILSSGLVGSVENENAKFHQGCSDAGAENATVNSNSTFEAKIMESIDTVAKNRLECPVDSRRPVFYGDILEETSPNSQGTLKEDADDIKNKNKRGGSKEKKKNRKRKKRAEMDKKQGVKRMKLPSPLKPKVVKVCEHYLKGRCLKGEECTYSHDATPLTKSKACVHFARNNCMKGDACPYDHQLWKYPCDNYASKGFCNRGSSCLFSHEIPAKKESQGTSLVVKISPQATPTPGTPTDGPMSSALKSFVKPAIRVPKGLSFLSMGNSSSNHLSRPDPSMSLQKFDVMGSNHSTDTVPGLVKPLGVTSIPFATPQSDHSNNNKNSILKARSSKNGVDLTSPLDQALIGLDSLISGKFPNNHFNNESHSRLSAKEHNSPLHLLNPLNMHPSFGSSVEKSGCKVGGHKGHALKSKSNAISNTFMEAPQEKGSEVLCPLTKSSTIEQSQNLNTTIRKDQKSDQIFCIEDRGKQKIERKSHTLSLEELNSPASVPSSSSSEGIAASKHLPAVFQKALLSTSTLASMLEPKTKGYSLGYAENSQLLSKPENSMASSSKSSFNCEPVKASAILDFIFGGGFKTKQKVT